MSTGKQVRMGRIRGADGKILMVAMDHAAIGGPMEHLERPRQALEAVMKGSPDSLLITRGMLSHGWEAIPSRVGLVMRISGGFTILEGAQEFRDRVISTVEDSLRWGVDGVAVTVKFGHELEGEFIQAASAVADACDRWGVPLLIEAMVALKGSSGLAEDEALGVAARSAAELGADLVKMKYPSKAGNLAAAIDGCPVPVLVLGGEKAADDEVLDMVGKAMADGAAGVAMGRNVWQRENPAMFLEKLHSLLGREGALE
jgi:DhnA family fructose-bisphosphate aldolase class Ia